MSQTSGVSHAFNEKMLGSSAFRFGEAVSVGKM
jgi:hypothetical protein